MKERKKTFTGKFLLKVPGKRQYFKLAGTTNDGGGESKPYAQTTERIFDSFPFQTEKSAQVMRKVLKERYGLQTQVVKWEEGRHHEA